MTVLSEAPLPSTGANLFTSIFFFNTWDMIRNMIIHSFFISVSSGTMSSLFWLSAHVDRSITMKVPERKGGESMLVHFSQKSKL